MNTKKVGGIMAALILPFSLLAWAQAPTNVQDRSAEAPQAEIRGTFSHAKDSAYLYDQIDLKIEFKSGAKFVLATRPGENIYVTVPTGNNTEKRVSLVVMPVPFGEKKPIARQDLLTRAPASIGFKLRPYCLNSLSDSNITDKTSAASCRARRVDDDGEDFVLPLSDLTKEDIAVGEKVEEIVTGTEITILEYRPSGHKSFQQSNPYSKCCRMNKGVEVCSCTVLSPTSSCDSGCPASETMNLALNPGG